MNYIQFTILFFLITFYFAHFSLPHVSHKDDISQHDKTQISKVQPIITFYTKEQTRDFIIEDKDNFINSLDKPNLIARKVNTKDEYKTISSKAATDFTKKEKEILTNVIIKVCDKLDGLSKPILKKYGLDKKLLLSLSEKWNIAKTKDIVFEMGMPHTRQNVIFLSSYYLAKNEDEEKKLIETILHEFYHIYQRIYTKRYQIFLKTKDWEIVPYNKTDKRINPDLDNLVWKRKDKIFIAKFNSLEPKDLKDISLKESRFEHPNEYYAYKLSQELK